MCGVYEDVCLRRCVYEDVSTKMRVYEDVRCAARAAHLGHVGGLAALKAAADLDGTRSAGGGNREHG